MDLYSDSINCNIILKKNGEKTEKAKSLQTSNVGTASSSCKLKKNNFGYQGRKSLSKVNSVILFGYYRKMKSPIPFGYFRIMDSKK